MPIPPGTVPIGGPLIDTTGALLTASATLRDAGVISFRGGRLRRVNAAGDGWVDIPGHVISATEPTETFDGQLWYDTANNQLMSYNGTSFAALTGTGGVTETRVQEIVDATDLSNLQGMVTDAQIPDAIMRDAELTAAAVRTLLGLSATEVNDLLTGASIAGQVVTFTQNDGTTATITLPAGSGADDGVVESGVFNATGTELVLTLDTGGMVTISVPALLRGGGALSDDDPEDVGPTAAPGAADDVPRRDHEHELPTDNTLDWSNSGHLGVSIADVVEHLQQSIRYYTTETDYSTDGSAAGQVYDTSRYPKNIARITAHLRPPTGIDDAIYRAGIYEVAANNDIVAVLAESVDTDEIDSEGTYTFNMLASSTSTLGVPLAGNERIAVLIRRIGAGDTADTGLRHGAEADASPNVSYADAELDFALDNHVIYRHEHPAVGNDTHSHGDNIRGNIRIYYTVTIDHGSLIGDGDANVTPEHIDSGDADDGQALLADGAGGAAFEALPIDFKGAYSGATAYLAGQSVSAHSHLWVAPVDIAAGGGMPNLHAPHDWLLLASAFHFRGNLNTATTYDMGAGDWYRVGARVFFVTGAVSIAGDDLLGDHANIIELTRRAADEVDVDASGFTGNLSSTDDDLQAALDTIDGLDLGSDGAGGGGSGYGAWMDIGSRNRSNFSGNLRDSVALDTGENDR